MANNFTNAINSTIGFSNSGAANTLTVQNTSNTASSDAVITTSVGGSSAGSPQHQFVISGVTTWIVGADNANSDRFAVSKGALTSPQMILNGNDLFNTNGTAGTSQGVINTHPSTTAGSKAYFQAAVANGDTGDDPYFVATLTGTQEYSFGLDNSDSDAFVIAASATLGTTNVMRIASTGEINFPLQSAFLAYNSTVSTDVTGDGTTANVVFDSEVFDQNSDFASNTYTAPITGRVQLNVDVLAQQATAAMSGVCKLVTSNRSYTGWNIGTAIVGNNQCQMSILADMDAADTASVQVTFSGGTKVVDIFGDGTTYRTTFSGYIAC